jgi:hypothetical protein
MTMRRRTGSWHLLAYFSVACTASTVPQPSQPLPSPSLPNPAPISSAAGPWTFNYAAGAIAYQISRTAGIESQSDSGSHRENSTNTTHELLTLELSGDTIHFTAIIDTSSTITQGAIGPVQSVPVPVQLSGSFIGDSLIFSGDSIAEKCNPVSSTLTADLHNLLIRFPIQLSQGSSWRDSVELTACQGMIPTTAHIARSYIVSGEAAYQGEPVLLVQRTDSILAHGEGAQQQHRVKLEASGTGSATYYISPVSGRVVHIKTGQDLDMAITASGKIHHFKQSSKEEFNLGR